MKLQHGPILNFYKEELVFSIIVDFLVDKGK